MPKEYQSNLLWSRLQTISAIQVGAFTGWYVLRDKELALANGALIFASLLTIAVWLIVYRDSQYLKKYEGDIPTGVSGISGKIMAHVIFSILLAANIFLLALSLCPQSQEGGKMHKTPTIPNNPTTTSSQGLTP
jgi:hypothetical protein